MLQGQVPTDIDIATSATPEQSLKLFKKGKSMILGSFRVSLGTDEFEVTTFREDDERSDGRHPETIVYTTDRTKDAARRDFTVNTMYWNPVSRELFDPYDGEADLKEKLIRFIGVPAVRIKHDALRILRAVRFRALLGGQYHPETYRALQEQAQLVDILSGERLRTELEKMLLGPHPDRALEDLWELQLLHRFLPELATCKGIPQPADYHHEGDVWDHTLRCARKDRDILAQGTHSL
jgi:poly(A) polymerase